MPTRHPRVSVTPRTHFPLDCTNVLFLQSPSRPTRLRVLSACHTPLSPETFDFGPQTFDRFSFQQKRARPRVNPQPNCENPRKVPAIPSSISVSSALAAVRYFWGVRSGSGVGHPTPSLHRTLMLCKLLACTICSKTLNPHASGGRHSCLLTPVHSPQSGPCCFPKTRADVSAANAAGMKAGVGAKPHHTHSYAPHTQFVSVNFPTR